MTDPTPTPPAPGAPSDEALSKSILNKLTWAVRITPADDPQDATFEYPFTAAEAGLIQRTLRSRQSAFTPDVVTKLREAMEGVPDTDLAVEMLAEARTALAAIPAPHSPETTNPLYYPLLHFCEAVAPVLAWLDTDDPPPTPSRESTTSSRETPPVLQELQDILDETGDFPANWTGAMRRQASDALALLTRLSPSPAPPAGSGEPVAWKASDEWVERVRLAIEDELIERRDARIALLGFGNGMVVCEKDGSPSPLIRMATREVITRIIEALPPLTAHPGAAVREVTITPEMAERAVLAVTPDDPWLPLGYKRLAEHLTAALTPEGK